MTEESHVPQRAWSAHCLTVVAPDIAARPFLNNGEFARLYRLNVATIRRLRRDIHSGVIAGLK